MSHTFFSVHTYLIFNAALVMSYIFIRCVINLPFVSKPLSQTHKLYFTRHSIAIIIFIFLSMPLLSSLWPSAYTTNFQIESFVKKASADFLTRQNSANLQMAKINSNPEFLNIGLFLFMILCLGSCFNFFKYITQILNLKKAQNNAVCSHQIKNIQISISQTAESPYCWSLFHNHYVIIPSSYLDNAQALKLALRHELQHIRQGDTVWLHVLALLHCINYWNPFIKLWIKFFDELQEFSCDEKVVLRKKTSPVDYAQCLVNAAQQQGSIPSATLGIQGLAQSLIYRRVNMLFNYRKKETKKLSLISAYIISFFAAVSTAYAVNSAPLNTTLSQQQIENLIKKSHFDSSFQVAATPEVVQQLNAILSSETARTQMRDSIERMQQYQPVIQGGLKKRSMPNELLAVPLVESGYRALDQSKNPVLAAGIWQIIPETAKRFGLILNEHRDDRLDTRLSTTAALSYLQENHGQFKDWSLAVMAYEIGEKQTAELIEKTGSKKIWNLAHSEHAPKNLSNFMATFQAELIIMQNPSLIASTTTY